MDLDSNPDILLVRKHLVEHLGPPDEVFEVRGSPLPQSPIQALHLSYFAPGGPEAPVVFSTCGACLFEMNDGRRVEAMMLFRRRPKNEAIAAIHKLLSSFAVFAEANNEAVRIGDVVRAPEELHRFSAMDAILFLPPVPFVESFHNIPLPSGRTAEMIWLLPVYEAEARYALENGPQALMMLFAAQGLDLTETERDEANTMIRPEDARVLAEKRSEEERKKAESQPRPQATRPRPQQKRSSLGAGSFEVADQGDAVAITRRGGAKPAKPRGDVPGAPPAPEERQPPPRAPSLRAVPDLPEPPQPREDPGPRAAPPNLRGVESPQRGPGPGAAAAAPKRRPLVAAAPPPREVRFDLATGEQTRTTPAVGAAGPRGPQRPAAAPSAGPGKPGAPGKPTAPATAAAKKPEPVPDTPEARAEAKKKKIEELKAKAADAAKRAAERASGGGEPGQGT